MSSAQPIRLLTEADLAACMDLPSGRRGPSEAKWRLLLTAGQGYGVDAREGGLAAAVILTRFDDGPAVLGLLVTALHYRRQGLAGRLVEHLCQVSGEDPIRLYSTMVARPLYERLGFRTVGAVRRHRGWYLAAPDPDPRVRRARAADLPGIVELDRRAFGADRRSALKHVTSFASSMAVADSGGELIGYAASWDNGTIRHVGPVVAADPDVAVGLADRLAREAPARVRLDIPEDASAAPSPLARWAVDHGLMARSAAPLMVHGSRDWPAANSDHYHAILMQAMG
jgi:predicted N-acetyltransferase YhbS